ncbi:MAG: hypothetical protein NC078_09190 [Ruminococcus sp.]|nr:hypothetical protein [Ruminococcus sp.]
MKKIIAVFCSIVCAVSVMGIAVSAENYHVTPTPDYLDAGGVSLHSENKPDKTWNLATKGRYDFSGVSSNGKSLYSNYNFTGVDQITLYVNNKKNISLTVKVYKNVFGFDSLVDTFTIPANSSKTFDRGTWSKDEQYYLNFSSGLSSNLDFSGYIEKLKV